MLSQTKVSMGMRLVLGLVLMGGISACDLDSVLEVSDPSRFTDQALDNPLALKSVANGVEGNLHFSVANIVINTGLLSDELMHTGTWSGYEDSDKGRHRPPPNVGFDIASKTIVLRAKKAAERFEKVMGDSANRTELMARVKAAEGWALLLIAQSECEGVVDGGGAVVPDAQVYDAAITALTRAIEVSLAAKSTKYENFARAGRARAYLMAGKYAEAAADAQKIPKGFLYEADYSETSTSNSLVTLNHYSENKAAGLDARRWSRVDTTKADGKDYFLDHFSGQPDPRVQVWHRIVATRKGVDGITKFYSQNKYNNRGSDIPMTHWKEMRLIEAEVAWKNGQFQAAIDKMNEIRTDASVGLPPLTNPGTSQAVLNYLLEERFATLFLEGQRANDLYRFNLFPTVIGTGYNTKFPMSNTEMLNNPNISQPRSCPAVS